MGSFMVRDLYVPLLLKIIDCDYTLYVTKGPITHVSRPAWRKPRTHNNRNKIV